MTRKIMDLRKVDLVHPHWVADVLIQGCINKFSVPLSEVTAAELEEYANTDPEHVALVEDGWIKSAPIDVQLPAGGEIMPGYTVHHQLTWQAEAEAQAADFADWQAQITELRNE